MKCRSTVTVDAHPTGAAGTQTQWRHELIRFLRDSMDGGKRCVTLPPCQCSPAIGGQAELARGPAFLEASLGFRHSLRSASSIGLIAGPTIPSGQPRQSRGSMGCNGGALACAEYTDDDTLIARFLPIFADGIRAVYDPPFRSQNPTVSGCRCRFGLLLVLMGVFWCGANRQIERVVRGSVAAVIALRATYGRVPRPLLLADRSSHALDALRCDAYLALATARNAHRNSKNRLWHALAERAESRTEV